MDDKTGPSELDPFPGQAVTKQQRQADNLMNLHKTAGDKAPKDRRPPILTEYDGWPTD